MEIIEIVKPGQTPRYKRVMYVDENKADRLLFEKMARQENATQELVLFDALDEAKQYVTMIRQNFPSIIYCDMMMLNNKARVFDFVEHFSYEVNRESQRKSKIIVLSTHTIGCEEKRQLEILMNTGLIYNYYEKPVNKTPELFRMTLDATHDEDEYASVYNNTFQLQDSVFPSHRPRYYEQLPGVGYFIRNNKHSFSSAKNVSMTH